MEQKRPLPLGVGTEIPPLKEFVRIYFSQKGLSALQADHFYLKNELVRWTDNKGKPVKNWKTLASDWIWKLKYN